MIPFCGCGFLLVSTDGAIEGGHRSRLVGKLLLMVI